ncbi:choice-of-anchor F family protein [Thiomicrorhabdus heinhorstiae]|uniref:Choice-of-anchor F family protein n=1 Tax=Thiomicrorhabdus heinhorstiae TaxID=2748010 RepID=A0ABS0C431_9GAMM|nr:choice-of-anchor F family protein [Thiomicrorhabdus heinhorstiae]MBF6059012.1 choice-of-anchor F family protein [Thiomicrorhabdus heinhorstiae]
MSVAMGAHADTITGIQGTNVGTQSQVVQDYDFTSLVQFGWGGWNHDNVSVKIVNAETGEEIASKSFDNATGAYSAMVEGESFASYINNGVNVDSPTGKLTGKDWPVGEPSGVKVLTDTDTVYMSNGKPASCIMSTSFHPFSDESKYVADETLLPEGATLDDGLLDSQYVNPTMCDSAFQTHKRFKVSALPESVAEDGTGKPVAIDMVFNVQNSDTNAGGLATTRYMVLQKLNNYTDKHLKGFTLQVGTGVGTAFTPNTTTTVELSDGVGEKDGGGDIWDADDRATFSAGLFGPGDDKHDPGFFDNVKRAGFEATEGSAPETTVTNQITSGAVLADTYETLFGSKWLPSMYEPKGIFYDFDNDPATDDQLVAWWGDNPNTPEEDYMWLKGMADDYAPVTAEELTAWATSSEPYYVGGIEDVLNLGLSYVIDVGEVTDTTGTFTLRMIPLVDETKTDYVPGYEEPDNQPPETLDDYVPADDGDETYSNERSLSAYDNASLLAMIFGFLGLGALIARRKLSK